MESTEVTDNFEVKQKNSTEGALERWRKLAWLIKNKKRRFRFTANLAKRFKARAIQRDNSIRSHAQKYFLKVQKNGSIAHVPPPRPKRKATHPYPQTAAKNVLLPLQTSVCYPSSMSSLASEYTPWDDTSQLISPSGGIMTSQDEYNLHGIEADSGSRGTVKISNISSSGIGSSSREIPTSELSKQKEHATVLHGIPDFSEVYSFIGSVFDTESKGHVQKLKEMDPINVETVLLLMRNLAVNLSSTDFEPMRYPLKDILSATSNFSRENLIAECALGRVYKGQFQLTKLIVQRLDYKNGHGDELQAEILMIKSLEHKNIVSLYGYCDENNEKIIIYKTVYGTLSQHLSDRTLTWSQRLQICLGVARGLNYIHYDVIHCDINSSKIILEENWEPKIYGFELSTKYPQSWRHRLLFSRYFDTNNLTPKYDVYSFGVLLLEVLCGRKPLITNDGIQEDLDEIIDPSLRKQMDSQTLAHFTNIAYKCVNQQHVQRPTMDQVVKDLEEVMELHWEHADLKEHSKTADEGTSSNNMKMDFLKIPLREIRLATNGFSQACFVGSGGYAQVYRAKLDVIDVQSWSAMEGKIKDEVPKISKTVAIKRITNRTDEQAKQGFLTEIALLSSCKHPNIVSLLGFSQEASEMILVYEFALKGSLADYLVSNDTVILTWAQRIKICLDVANGIKYLHTDMEGKPRIIHRDIKSDNILFDENMNAKVADFGLSKSHPMNQQPSTFHSKNIAGTTLYMDPESLETGKYKRESDIYSFGVVLFEILSGRVAYDSVYTNENELGLAPVARRRFNEGTIKELIDPKIIEEDDGHIFTLNRRPNQDSFHTFSKIAYQCLAETQAKRPTIEVVIKELQTSLKLQGETVVLLRFRLGDIVFATENFAETYCIDLDNIGKVYKAELDHFDNRSSLATKGKYIGEPSKNRISVAIKRITGREGRQGLQEFFEEIELRASYKHPNIVSLLGFCDEDDEMILIYEPVSGRSLDDYLKSVGQMSAFTWTHRLHMCLEIARGLNHLHTKMVKGIIHIDIKSANILLDEKSRVKVGYFVISKLDPSNQESGVKVYEAPEYKTKGELKGEYDVYSFGVVLLEIFCGRVAYDPVYIEENEKGLAPIARKCFNNGTIHRIIDPSLKEEMSRGLDIRSLDTFLNTAFQCLEEATQRPTMEMVIKELESALNFQVGKEKSHQ